MEKEQFKRELKLALKNPKAYFDVKKQKDPITNKTETVCNTEKLNRFFQVFSTHYLDADIAGLAEQFPKIEFATLEDRDKFAVGKYNNKNKQIDLNLDMFLAAMKTPLKTGAFAGYMVTLCHVHQHFKQYLYADLKKNGNLEAAQKLEPMLGLSPNSEYGVSVNEIEEVINKPISSQSLVAHEVFMSNTIPEKYKQMRSNNFIVNELGKKFGKRSPIEMAYYFHDPHEVDARERAVEVFYGKMTEISGGDPEIEKPLKSIEKFLKLANKTSLKIQPKEVIDKFVAEKENINEEQLLSFASKIQSTLDKEKIDTKTLHDENYSTFGDGHPTYDEVERYSFIIVLKERLASLPPEEANKLAESLGASGIPYVSYVLDEVLSSKTIDKVESSQIKAERSEMGENSPTIQAPQKQKTRQNELELEKESQPE